MLHQSRPDRCAWEAGSRMGCGRRFRVCVREINLSHESWFCLITQDDLARTMLAWNSCPTDQKLAGDPEFQQLLVGDKAAFDMLAQFKPLIAERIDKPKQLRDLIE